MQYMLSANFYTSKEELEENFNRFINLLIETNKIASDIVINVIYNTYDERFSYDFNSEREVLIKIPLILKCSPSLDSILARINHFKDNQILLQEKYDNLGKVCDIVKPYYKK